MKLLLLSTAAVSVQAAAQQAPVDQCVGSPADCVTIDDPRIPDPHDIVVTAAGVPQDAGAVGQAVTVIDRETIEQRQTVAISDLLATTPGVTVSRSGGLGTLTTLNIRGAEGDQTLVLIDGVRVNDPSSAGGGFDFANLLAGSVERVEVLRGPNAVPWGSQAIGGVVNVVTQQPIDGFTGHAQIEGGSFGTAYGSGGIAGGNERINGALTAGWLTTDGISAYDQGKERDGYDQVGGTGRVNVALAPGIGLDLRGYYAHSRVDIDGYPAPDYVFADDGEYTKTQEAYGYAGAHADFADGRFRNRVAVTVADINRDSYDPSLGDAPLYVYRGRSERYEYQGDYTLGIFRLVGGVEHEDSRLVDRSDDVSVSTGVTSEYGEAIVNPVRALTLTAGVRNDDHDVYGSHVSFGANAALRLDTGTTVRGSYAEGFKAPTLYQLYAPVYGNADLKPETAKSYDVGVEQRLIGDQLVASVTAFHRDTHNQIDGDPLTFVYFNYDRTRAKGVEVALTMRPVDGFTIAGSYSFVDTENLTPGANFGNDLARRPRQSASVSADYRFGFGLSVGGTVRMAGDSFDNAANTTRLDGYALAGIRAEMPVTRTISVYGRLDNAFDAHYETVAGYGTYGRAAYGGVRVRLD
ncbi:TonB-dependent receptor [Sphingomonas koreensis]|nr:TonB-dependent receptor [Sphingomonas koreensis]